MLNERRDVSPIRVDYRLEKSCIRNVIVERIVKLRIEGLSGRLKSFGTVGSANDKLRSHASTVYHLSYRGGGGDWFSRLGARPRTTREEEVLSSRRVIEPRTRVYLNRHVSWTAFESA